MTSISPYSGPGQDPLPVLAGDKHARPASSPEWLVAKEPDYQAFFDAKALRRMSRIVKMGVAAATGCLQQAGEKMPGAIVTGTAYGCLEDTGSFLNRLISQQEEMLSPTPFIQSTHNTVGAQIALILQCTNYNNTFVHRGFSFESALLDAMLLLEEETADTVLTGSVDEITKDSFAILRRFGLYRHTMAGEGAAFFLLTRQPSAQNIARLEGLDTLYKPRSQADIENWIKTFLSARGIGPHDLHLVLLGSNGNPATDLLFDQIADSIFAGITCTGFKGLCGEYPTASSFALHLACGMLNDSGPKRILIYNHYLNIHHSLMLVSRC